MREYSDRNSLKFRFFAFIFIFAPAFCGLFGPSHPSDAKLMANFQQNKADFVRFEQILKETGLKDSKNSGAVKQALRELTSKIPKFPNQFNPDFLDIKNNSACFVISSFKAKHRYGDREDDLMPYDSIKGYCWVEDDKPTGPIVDNLDAFDSNVEKKMSDKDYRRGADLSSFRKVEGNWYIYCDVPFLSQGD